MTHTVGVRAASFATSAALLGVLVIGAFSVSITLQATTSAPPPFIVPFVEVPPDPPPPTTSRRDPPPRPLDEPQTTDLSPDPQPLEPISDPVGPPTTWQPPGPPQITNPRWLRQPRDLERYYPARALAREIPGQVVLDCLVTVNGTLNCAVVSETPNGWGFGAAALRIAAEHRMVPASREGQAMEGRYRMRVPFEVR
ncbi:MAG: TonB family protein [Hyphomonadaceae bacterium]